MRWLSIGLPISHRLWTRCDIDSSPASPFGSRPPDALLAPAMLKPRGHGPRPPRPELTHRSVRRANFLPPHASYLAGGVAVSRLLIAATSAAWVLSASFVVGSCGEVTAEPDAVGPPGSTAPSESTTDPGDVMVTHRQRADVDGDGRPDEVRVLFHSSTTDDPAEVVVGRRGPTGGHRGRTRVRRRHGGGQTPAVLVPRGTSARQRNSSTPFPLCSSIPYRAM